MKNNKIYKLRKEYMDVPIPEELDFITQKSMKEGKKIYMRKKYSKKLKPIASSVAVATIIFTAAVNTTPVFANALSNVPLVSGLVRVLTIKDHAINEIDYNANIERPVIDGLENEDLQNTLNEKYINENKKLYDEFIVDIGNLKENGGGHLGIDSGYEIKTDSDRILSIGRYVVNTSGSSSTTFKYDTIDKEKEILITLPSLFKDDSYLELISNNIREQMIEEMKADDGVSYFTNEESNEVDFHRIDKGQNFYINSEHKLVISFNKYEVAPGYMGIVEFTIPTDILSNILVSSEYIK